MAMIILFKKSAAGLYTFEATHVASITGGMMTAKYGLANGTKIPYTKQVTAKQFDAIIKKKRQEGYKSLSDIGIEGGYNALDYKLVMSLLPCYCTDNNNDVKICKCKPFVPGKFDYEPVAWAQPKINGNRVKISWGMKGEGMFKTEGVLIKSHEGIELTIKHVEQIFDIIFQQCEKHLVFDGEMYVRGEPVTSISGACRNPHNPIHDRLNYHCFDLAIPDVDQTTRLEIKRKALISDLVFHQKNVVQHSNGTLDQFKVINVSQKQIETDDEATEYRDKCLANGYEGCVIRNGLATYQFGSRTKHMMKLKRAQHATFTVRDINKYGFENTENNVGKGINFVLKNNINDGVFECKPSGLDVDQQLDMYVNRSKVIGTDVTVRFYERTVDGFPFHANVII